MPPTASRVSDQFSPTTGPGSSSMVLCQHCKTQRLPKNSLQRKEEHLLVCASFALSPLATARDPITQKTMLEESIARRAHRTKPGNMRGGGAAAGDGKELLRLQRIGAAFAYAGDQSLSERVERILRGRGEQDDEEEEENVQSYPELGVTGFSRASAATTAAFDHRQTNPETLAALLDSANTRDADSPALVNPRKRTLPLDLHDGGGDATASPGLTVARHLTGFTPPQSESSSSSKRLKYAELYLDEGDFEFVCSALGQREQRFVGIVERLARLVRLRDRA